MNKHEADFVVMLIQDLISEKKVTLKEFQLRYGNYGIEMLKSAETSLADEFKIESHF